MLLASGVGLGLDHKAGTKLVLTHFGNSAIGQGGGEGAPVAGVLRFSQWGVWCQG